MDPGLCARCRHAQVVDTGRSRFWRCGLHDEAPARFPRYPPLPVVACAGFSEGQPTEL